MKTVNILGEEYKIFVDDFNTPELKEKKQEWILRFLRKRDTYRQFKNRSRL